MTLLIRTIKFFGLVFFALAVLVPIAKAQAACPAAASSVERALCEQPALQVLLDALARNWQSLQSLQSARPNCAAQVDQTRIKARPHAVWWLEVQTGFNGFKGVSAQHYLGSSFTQRADELAYAQSLCDERPRADTLVLRIDTIALPKHANYGEANTVLFVQTMPAQIGQRINAKLFKALLGIEPPASLQLGAVRKALALMSSPSADAPEPNETLEVVELSRSSRLLLLQINTGGSHPRMWQNSEQRLFDLRTGDQVEPVDLLSANGRRKFNRLADNMVLQAVQGERKRDVAHWSPEGVAGFDLCVAQWRGTYTNDGKQIVWLAAKLGGNSWQVAGPACTGYEEAHPPNIVSKALPVAQLLPYLSAYGKSMLLNVGDVRTPVAPELACKAQAALPDPQGWAARVKEVSVGEDHAFLRETSGRVWGWGRNYSGAVGNGNPGDGGGSWVAPFLMDGDYLYAGAGQGFSATVRRDGSLWTWGSDYGGKLGDGGGSRSQPVQIGSNFAHADVDNYGGRALAKDARLWAWGGGQKQRLAVLAHNVRQVNGSRPMLVLQQGGSLLSTNEWDWLPPGEATSSPAIMHWLGSGFTQLPRTNNLQLAWRADGSAWAWGRTLSGMASPKSLPGLDQSPWPRLVGGDWVDVKAAGDSSLIAARKADGSLWVSQYRGSQMRMERVGCGFADMAFAHDDKRPVQLLALRTDGSLLGYQSSNREGSNPQRDLLERKPQVLATQVVKLLTGGDYWGSSAGTVLLLRQDGTLWQWYWRFGGRYPKEGVPSDKKFEKIAFPDAWFQKRGPK